MQKNNNTQNSAKKVFFGRIQIIIFRISTVGLLGFMLAGCTASTVRVKTQQTVEQTIPSTTVYYYPTSGQTPAQQDRDHYECYLWAVNQTGFDPGQAELAPHQRIEIVPITPSGSDVAAGAASGAVIGSMLSGPHSHGKGLVFGLITGILFGAASEMAKQDQIDQLQQQFDNQDKQRYSRLEKQAEAYRRAMSACLDGRGYQVQ